MTNGSSAMRQIGTLFGSGTVAGMTDGQLLDRFLSRRDEGAELAFAALVARHGPMVLGVCRRALPDPGDVDDAFQATFLILVRKARSVRVEDSLGRWLYGVSRKVAARARVVASRRRRQESGPLDEIEARPVDLDRFEVRATLDEELARLPEAYRSAIVLCDLAGLSHEEAARDLRCPVGTIKSRLSRGRARLRVGLERRGLAPSFAMVAPPVPARLLEGAALASSASKVGGASAVGMVPASAAVLAEGMLKTMTGLKLKLAATAALTIGLAATGAGVMARQDKVEAKTPETKALGALGPGEKQPSDEMEKKLLQPVTLNFQDTPLEEAIRHLRVYTGLNIVLDPKTLADRGLTSRAPVNISTQGVRLKSALKFLLRPLDLTFTAEDDVVLITGLSNPPDRRLAQLVHGLELLQKRLSSYRRIVRDPKDPAFVRVQADMDSVIDEIRAIVRGQVEQDDRVIPASPPREQEPDRPMPVPASPPKEFAKVSMPNYVVEPPDMLTIEVLEALPGRPITGERLVRPDGKINLGFYGEVYVAGLTPVEIKEKVIQHLRKFLSDETLGLTRPVLRSGRREEEGVDPRDSDRVSVDVSTYNSKVYYVQGEVATPGRLPVTGNETVLDAINYAGGLRHTALPGGVHLVRPATPGAQGEQVLPVDFDAIVHKGDSKTNYQLFPGDRLIVDRDPNAITDPNVETRLRTVELKLDEVLKALERLPKPATPPG